MGFLWDSKDGFLLSKPILYSRDFNSYIGEPSKRLSLPVLDLDDIFMEKREQFRTSFAPSFASISSTVHREVKKLTKISAKFFKASVLHE